MLKVTLIYYRDGGALVSMVLYPATGDDEESRYVTVTLEIVLCNSYPKVIYVLSHSVL